jgi:AbiV family abortive infection protein
MKQDKVRTFRDALAMWVESMPTEVRQKANQRLKTKQVLVRFRRNVDAINELLMTKRMLSGASLDEDGEQFNSLAKHATQLWLEARDAFTRGSHALAKFLAIVSLEEVGKVSVARFEIALRECIRRNGGDPNLAPPSASVKKSKKGPFYSHTKKHLLAAGAGALVNSRLDRRLGIDRINTFLNEVDTGEIERTRQKCLYADCTPAGPRLPADLVTESDAGFYVALAGEILAEVAGFEVSVWQRLLTEVNAFEESLPAGIVLDHSDGHV